MLLANGESCRAMKEFETVYYQCLLAGPFPYIAKEGEGLTSSRIAEPSPESEVVSKAATLLGSRLRHQQSIRKSAPNSSQQFLRCCCNLATCGKSPKLWRVNACRFGHILCMPGGGSAKKCRRPAARRFANVPPSTFSTCQQTRRPRALRRGLLTNS